MQSTRSYRNHFIFLGIFFLFILLLNISLGSVAIPLEAVLQSLFGGEVEKESWRFIITEYRLPKAITAIIAGGVAFAIRRRQTA